MLTKVLELIEQTSRSIVECKNRENLSSLDRDLILEKIRRLYETVLFEDTASSDADRFSENAGITVSEPFITPPREEAEAAECELYDPGAPAEIPAEYTYDGALNGYMTRSALQTIFAELFESDNARANRFLHTLDDFQDLDQAILYIQENLSEKLNSPSVSILADALTAKLA